jgi:hypothetical protein
MIDDARPECLKLIMTEASDRFDLPGIGGERERHT